MKVGFIGLGAMGLPMAKNVIKGGHELLTMVHNRRQPADELSALGAKVLSSPAEIAGAAEVVVTVLPADAELEEVVLGKEGLSDGLHSGQALIDMTTATSITLIRIQKALEKAGVEVLDAPVSGGTPKAASGELTIIVGGGKELFARYRPLLETMGTTLFHVGDVGAGKVVKMVNQLLAATHLLVIGEAFALGKKAGADPSSMYEVIKASSGYSRMMDLRLPGFLLDGTFDPGFKLDLMKKDVNLAVDSARALNVPIHLGGLVSQLFAAASAAGLGEMDFAAAGKFVADLGGVDLSAASQKGDTSRSK